MRGNRAVQALARDRLQGQRGSGSTPAAAARDDCDPAYRMRVDSLDRPEVADT